MARLVKGVVGPAVVTGLILFSLALQSVGQPERSDGYAPVTSPAVLHATLKDQLKLVRSWLDDKDFLSAAEASQGLAALSQLAPYYFDEPEARKKAAAFSSCSSRLLAAARAKNADESNRQIQEYDRLLGELAKAPQGKDKAAGKPFKPAGSMKTWMLLIDGAYSDAKTAKSAEELELLAGAVAEEANAIQFLRADARWRKAAVEVRDLALETTARAKANELNQARVVLGKIQGQCRSCHDTHRR